MLSVMHRTTNKPCVMGCCLFAVGSLASGSPHPAFPRRLVCAVSLQPDLAVLLDLVVSAEHNATGMVL
jgi:hypothetical protein